MSLSDFTSGNEMRILLQSLRQIGLKFEVVINIQADNAGLMRLQLL